MRSVKIPNIFRNLKDSSITLSYQQPKCSLIWLHGLCDQAQTFVSLFSHSTSPLYWGAKVKLIQAPKRFVTINQQQGNSWYDLRSLNRFTEPEEKVFDLQQFAESFKIVDEHVKSEINFWTQNDEKKLINPIHRIYVGGFSQGGVVALNYGLQAQSPPAGVITLSGYLLKKTIRKNLRRLPILLLHGARDPVIKQVEALKSYQDLIEDKHLVQYHSYPKLDHSICLQELDLIKNWLNNSHEFIRKHYEKQTL